MHFSTFSPSTPNGCSPLQDCVAVVAALFSLAEKGLPDSRFVHRGSLFPDQMRLQVGDIWYVPSGELT